MTIRERARRGLLIYFGVVLLVSAALEGWIIARLAGHEGFGDVSFRWGGAVGTRASVTAWLIPLAIGFVAYGVAWATGLANFTLPTGGPFATITNPVARLAASIPLALTVGTVVSCLTAFGEELGLAGLHVAEAP